MVTWRPAPARSSTLTCCLRSRSTSGGLRSAQYGPVTDLWDSVARGNYEANAAISRTLTEKLAVSPDSMARRWSGSCWRTARCVWSMPSGSASLRRSPTVSSVFAARHRSAAGGCSRARRAFTAPTPARTKGFDATLKRSRSDELSYDHRITLALLLIRRRLLVALAKLLLFAGG
jgi:hypothetical protein